MYEPGQEDTLDYHVLVTGFLHELCSRTRAPVYCATASHLDAYLKTAPTLGLLNSRARAGEALTIRFRLSKVAHVGIVVVRNGRNQFLTSADFGYGVHAFSVPAHGTWQLHDPACGHRPREQLHPDRPDAPSGALSQT